MNNKSPEREKKENTEAWTASKRMVYKERPKQQTSKVSLYIKRDSQAADLKGQVKSQQGSSKID